MSGDQLNGFVTEPIPTRTTDSKWRRVVEAAVEASRQGQCVVLDGPLNRVRAAFYQPAARRYLPPGAQPHLTAGEDGKVRAWVTFDRSENVKPRTAGKDETP